MSKAVANEQASAPVVQPVKIKPADGTKLKKQEYVRQTWFLRANPGDTEETIRGRDWWRLLSDRLTRHDVVFVLMDDESQEIEYRVEAVGTGWAEVRPVRTMTRTPVSKAVEILGDGAYRLEFVGGSGFCVVRIKDGCPVTSGHATADSARMTWLREQPRKVA